MSKVYIFLADGFEDIEGLTVVDLMRRPGIDIETVSIKNSREITTSHNITMYTDRIFEGLISPTRICWSFREECRGTKYLGEYAPLQELLRGFYEKGGKVAAICAAPSIFGSLGFLKNRKATAYPSFMGSLEGRGNSGRSGGRRRKCDHQPGPGDCHSLCAFSDRTASGEREGGGNRRICGVFLKLE